MTSLSPENHIPIDQDHTNAIGNQACLEVEDTTSSGLSSPPTSPMSLPDLFAGAALGASGIIDQVQCSRSDIQEKSNASIPPPVGNGPNSPSICQALESTSHQTTNASTLMSPLGRRTFRKRNPIQVHPYKL